MVKIYQRLLPVLITAISVVINSCHTAESRESMFTELSPATTNIDFRNTLTQTEDFNIIEYLYFYNGGGVSAGDINNDGLIDLYFTSNQGENKLYLNKGNFVFEDITRSAGVGGVGNWKTGTTMADVNGDGYLDIFVCGVGNYKKFDGRNQLFINNGDMTFTDRSKEYGLAFQGFSTQAAFFDYDNDGDLDMYLLNHSVHTTRSYGHSRLRHQSDVLAGDKLYRNELVPSGKPRFTQVTARAGIYSSQIGYGLGVAVSDVNNDGYADIYVSNDFHENDYLYINQRDGTFVETVSKSLPHVSRFSMGNDIADINNDGRFDIMVLDMLPREESIIKTTAGEEPYDIYQFKLRFGYHHQFSRNTLQLNRGIDGYGKVLFSDVAAFAGVEASDWSWAPLLADFDNDGYKDIFIANGIVTRPNDLDYINFISSDTARQNYDYEAFIRNMPSGKVANMFFRNQGGFHFEDVSSKWAQPRSNISTGAAYADLDNDGDLDLIVNNINEHASIYRNNSSREGNWLQVEFQGDAGNRFGIGAKVLVYTQDNVIVHEQFLTRGWESSVSPVMHIGVGDGTVDSVTVIWPGGNYQTIKSDLQNRRIRVAHSHAVVQWDYRPEAQSTLFRRKEGPFEHKEDDFNAFNGEKLIPHMVSTQGPRLAVADVNGDGLEDFFVGGAAGQAGELFLQRRAGGFVSSSQQALAIDSASEDTGSVFFDADGNGTQDLLVVSGGQRFTGTDRRLGPRLYLNDGQGNFTRASSSLPELFVDASCVEVADIDADADADIFIGGRVVAGEYGRAPRSYLLINKGKGRFADESFRLAATGERANLGMVTDACWDDINGDGRLDLIVVGEWMPITVLVQNADGNFANRTAEYGLAKTAGWWNVLHRADVDADGDMDFLAGNLGKNSRLRPTSAEPVSLYVGDMDGNGGTDHLLTYYNSGVSHPFISRDQLVKQVPSFRRDFLKYSTFRHVKREQIIPPFETGNYLVLHVDMFSSVLLKRQGGRLVISELPADVQLFPVFGFEDGDFDGDKNTDLLAVGNLSAVQPDLGRYDAGYGLMLSGDGAGGFKPVPLERSGFVVQGQGRDIRTLRSSSGKTLILVTRNNERMLIFE